MLFWEDIRDLICADPRLLGKWYPTWSQSARTPEVRVFWASLDDKDESDRAHAQVKEGILELPGARFSHASILERMESEIADCDNVIAVSAYAAHHEQVKRYRERCVAFGQTMRDESAFLAWFAHKQGARWFSIGISNDGDCPAEDIHVRLEPPCWLRFMEKKQPCYDGPPLPGRPKLGPRRALAGLALAQPYYLPFGRADFSYLGARSFWATVENGAIEVHGRHLLHKHQTKPFGDLAVLVLPGHPSGDISLKYSIFHRDLPEWEAGQIALRVQPPTEDENLGQPSFQEQIQILKGVDESFQVIPPASTQERTPEPTPPPIDSNRGGNGDEP